MAGIYAALLTFAVSFVCLSIVEKIIHYLTKNPDQSYKIGVWTFSVLIAIYFYFDYIGR